MTVELLLFAGIRELLGVNSIQVELPSQATYGDLVQQLTTQHPAAEALVRASRIAAAGEFVSFQSTVDPRAELALIPPVSGG